MNYWLVCPKNEGVFTDLSEESFDCVYMGWGEDKCSKFYNEIKTGDVIIVTEGSHLNTKPHYIGIADTLYKEDQCWSLSYSTIDKNDEVANIIKSNPADFSGGLSRNPWGPTYSIIKLRDNPSEEKIKVLLNNYFKDIITKKNMKTIVNLLENNHNLILTGAPGTGKTYLAKQIAEQMIMGEVKSKMTKEEEQQFSEQCEFVQFHPSYDYTDFVEGLRPVNNDDGEQIGFKRKDGVFKKFCERALKTLNGNQQIANFDEVYNLFIDDILEEKFDKPIELETPTQKKKFNIRVNRNRNLYAIPQTEVATPLPITKEMIQVYLESGEIIDWKPYLPVIGDYMKDYIKSQYGIELTKKSYDKSAKYIFIIDEINRGEISKIFGELFFSIDPGYRGKNGKIQTQYANMQDGPNDFDKASGITESDNRDNFGHFFVPENVYIIGTMNDIDRSVESMDFAFRRRFAFKEIKATDSVNMLYDTEKGIGEYADKAEKRMINLNKAIETIEGLSSAYHIGPAYFLKLKNYKDDCFKQLWDNHIEGLLREYLRGMQGVTEKMITLENAYNDESDTPTNNG